MKHTFKCTSDGCHRVWGADTSDSQCPDCGSDGKMVNNIERGNAGCNFVFGDTWADKETGALPDGRSG
jgi:hypothetical protein